MNFLPNQPERILVVFIHGFRGSDSTFKEFPEQFRTSLSSLLPQAHINIAVYPKFETRGSLTLATENFCSWLKGIESQRRKQTGGEIPLLTLLLGHSMGGLLAGDAFLRYQQEKELPFNEFPHILGVLAFDSPFYGVNSNNLKRSALSRATNFGSQISTVASGLGLAGAANVATRSATPAKSSNFRTFALGGLAVAAAGAYMYKEHIPTLYSYAMDHFDFVNALGKPNELNNRVGSLMSFPDALFYCFYLEISRIDGKTSFINLPGEGDVPSIASDRFIAVESNSQDEINAHTTMFNPAENLNYLTLTKQAVALSYRAIKQYQANIASMAPGPGHT